MTWKNFVAQTRLKWGIVFVLFFLIFSKPANLLNFILGLEICLLGEFIRLWSAGYIRKSETLCTSGPYAYLRNPLYLGSFLIGFGFCLGATTRKYWVTAAILWLLFLILFWIIYYPTIKNEEKYLQEKFGEEFSAYRASVPSFFPRWSLWSGKAIAPFSWHQIFINKEHHTLGAIILIWIILGLKFYWITK